MNKYELSVLVHPDLDANIDGPIKKITALVTDNGGKIITEDNAGKKRLTYKIKNQDFAIYLFWDVELPAQAVAKIQDTLNITDEVLRYLLVTVDEKGRQAQAESKQRESQDSAESEE